MNGPNRRDIEQWLNRLESEESDVERVRIPPAQAKRLEVAFRTVDEPIDPEDLANRFVYGPSEDDAELITDEAAAFRIVEWRETFGEGPPWNGNDP